MGTGQVLVTGATGYVAQQVLPALQARYETILTPRPIELKGFVGATRARYFRDIAAYLSPRDLTQLVERAIDTPDIRDEHGVPWLVVYGVSYDIRRVLDSGVEVITEELVSPS
jgi:hypothetical protein